MPTCSSPSAGRPGVEGEGVAVEQPARRASAGANVTIQSRDRARGSRGTGETPCLVGAFLILEYFNPSPARGGYAHGPGPQAAPAVPPNRPGPEPTMRLKRDDVERLMEGRPAGSTLE